MNGEKPIHANHSARLGHTAGMVILGYLKISATFLDQVLSLDTITVVSVAEKRHGVGEDELSDEAPPIPVREDASGRTA
jgi:hypothetical protein